MIRLEDHQTYRYISDKELGFSSTEELRPVTVESNQELALSALRMGLSMGPKQSLFVCNGSDQQMINMLLGFLKENDYITESHDVVYHCNFEDKHSANYLILPPGSAKIINNELRQAIIIAYEKLKNIILSNEYKSSLQSIRDRFHRQINKSIGSLRKQMHEKNIELSHSAKGYELNPHAELSDAELEQANIELHVLKVQIADFEKREYLEIMQYNRDLVNGVLSPLLYDMKKEQKNDNLSQHFAKVIDHICYQLPDMGETSDYWSLEKWLDTYLFNILMDAGETNNIQVEANASEESLFGSCYDTGHSEIELNAFQFIRPGKVHMAYAGYLLIRVEPLLKNKNLWDRLKQAILLGYLEYSTSERIVPQKFPIHSQVLFIGDKDQYCQLMEQDSEFADIAPLLIEFEDELEINSENLLWYSRFISKIIHKYSLKHFHVSAVLRLIEYSSAYIEEQNRLTLEIDVLSQMMRHANYLASGDLVKREHVDLAIHEKCQRVLLGQRTFLRQVKENQVILQTEGKKVAQINGLAVITSGEIVYGICCRISAAVRIGDGDFLDIEREVELGGSLHSKGVLILTNYVGARYSRKRSLSIAASLVFEQSYGGIDGDSASLAELVVLLSAIGDIELNQEIALTGSVNQFGDVQSIGAVNEKIEAYYRVCKIKGITGKQGVIIPATNRQNLVLDKEIREAIRDNQFSIFTVTHVDEALEILTGLEIGQEKDGEFPEGTVNALISNQLESFTQNKNADKNEESEN